MNLGQLIGELQIKAHEAAEAAPMDAANPPAHPQRQRMGQGKRREQILALVQERGRVVVRDLVEGLGMTSGNASVTLLALFAEGQLQRTGERRHYEYSLP